jgi:hypothetical protein
VLEIVNDLVRPKEGNQVDKDNLETATAHVGPRRVNPQDGPGKGNNFQAVGQQHESKVGANDR